MWMAWMLMGILPEVAIVAGVDADPDPRRIEVPADGSLELAVAGVGLVRASAGARLRRDDHGLALTAGRVWVLSGARSVLGWAGRSVAVAPGTSVVFQASPPVVAVAQGEIEVDADRVVAGQVWSGRVKSGGGGLLASARMEWRQAQGRPWQLDELAVPLQPPSTAPAPINWGERELFGHPSGTAPLLERALLPVPRVVQP